MIPSSFAGVDLDQLHKSSNWILQTAMSSGVEVFM